MPAVRARRRAGSRRRADGARRRRGGRGGQPGRPEGTGTKHRERRPGAARRAPRGARAGGADAIRGAGHEVLLTHGDSLATLPEGFRVSGTSGSITAAIECEERKLYGVQFHPELKSKPFEKNV